MNQTTDFPSGYFGMALIATGFDLVRREHEEIRCAINVKKRGLADLKGSTL
jgi:hypothetical protein